MKKILFTAFLLLAFVGMVNAQNYRPNEIATMKVVKKAPKVKQARDGRDFFNLSVGYANFGGYNDYGTSAFPMQIDLGWHRFSKKSKKLFAKGDFIWESINASVSGDFGHMNSRLTKLGDTFLFNFYTGGKCFFYDLSSNWSLFAEAQLGWSWTIGMSALDKMEGKDAYNCGGWNAGAGVGIMCSKLKYPIYVSINDRFNRFHFDNVNVFSVKLGFMFQ